MIIVLWMLGSIPWLSLWFWIARTIQRRWERWHYVGAIVFIYAIALWLVAVPIVYIAIWGRGR